MFKKIAFFFILAASLSSCNDIYYDAETRLIIEGQLVDKNGAAIPNQAIDIQIVEKDKYYFSENWDIISSGNSGADGHFRFIIPGPEDPDNRITVRINYTDFFEYNRPFQNKSFLNIQKKDFVDYIYNFNQVVLYSPSDITSLIVYADQINAHNSLKIESLEGFRADRIFFVNPEPTNLVSPPEYYFDVRKNQTVTLHYSITDHSDPDNPVTTDYSLPIQIDSEVATHIITY